MPPRKKKRTVAETKTSTDKSGESGPILPKHLWSLSTVTASGDASDEKGDFRSSRDWGEWNGFQHKSVGLFASRKDGVAYAKRLVEEVKAAENIIEHNMERGYGDILFIFQYKCNEVIDEADDFSMNLTKSVCFALSKTKVFSPEESRSSSLSQDESQRKVNHLRGFTS